MDTITHEDKKVSLILTAIRDKKGVEVVAIDLREKAVFCDYFFIVSGTSSVHIETIADGIEDALAKEKIRIDHHEGIAESGWIVLDAGDAIVHIFHPEKRRFYNLERLWADARFLEIAQQNEPSAP